MKAEVYDYFINLEKQGLPMKGGYILDADPRITKPNYPSNYYCNVRTRTIDDTTFYEKHIFDNVEVIGSIASAEMYNAVGIMTPPIYLMKTPLSNPKPFKRHTVYSIQQDVTSLKDFICSRGGDNKQYIQDIYRKHSNFKWSILYDTRIRESFLSHMTPQCLNELINLFLLDELRTDIDRHTNNYFLCKSKDSDKWEHIIPIDLECMLIYRENISRKFDFDSFTANPYNSTTPQHYEDYRRYSDRMIDMRELLDDGVLSKSNVDTIKSALEYDFPKAIKKTCKKYHLHKHTKEAYNPVAHLWEYNRNTIGRDLGL